MSHQANSLFFHKINELLFYLSPNDRKDVEKLLEDNDLDSAMYMAANLAGVHYQEDIGEFDITDDRDIWTA